MLMMLLPILSVIRHLVCDNNLNWLLNLNQIYETLLTGARNSLLILMLGKLSWFHLTSLITMVLLMWKWMGWFLRKNNCLRCWGWPSLLNCIGALTLSLLLKLPPRKSGFPTGVENMAGGSSKFDGGCLSQYMGGSMGGLKCCQKYLWRSSFDSKVAG